MPRTYLTKPKSPPAAKPDPQVGEFLVIDHYNGENCVVGPVVRRTETKVFWRSPFGDRGVFFHRVLFAGDKAAAKLLCERLVSSQALRDEDMRRADLRHQKRVQAWIARAYANTLNPKDHERAEETHDPA